LDFLGFGIKLHNKAGLHPHRIGYIRQLGNTDESAGTIRRVHVQIRRHFPF
jgi:hypothetical protein